MVWDRLFDKSQRTVWDQHWYVQHRYDIIWSTEMLMLRVWHYHRGEEAESGGEREWGGVWILAIGSSFFPCRSRFCSNPTVT